MLIRPFKGKSPRVHESAFVAETATIVGDVEIGSGTSIWYGAVIRGDADARKNSGTGRARRQVCSAWG